MNGNGSCSYELLPKVVLMSKIYMFSTLLRNKGIWILKYLCLKKKIFGIDDFLNIIFLISTSTKLMQESYFTSCLMHEEKKKKLKIYQK